MKAAYPSGKVQPVPFEEWLLKLKASAEEAERDGNIDVERNPAIRLVDFYAASLKANKSSRVLPTTASTQASQTLRKLGPLSRGWLENWMKQWSLQLA